MTSLDPSLPVTVTAATKKGLTIELKISYNKILEKKLFDKLHLLFVIYFSHKVIYH